jgi:hypothetical protein
MLTCSSCSADASPAADAAAGLPAAGCAAGLEGVSLLQLRGAGEEDWSGDEVLVHYDGQRPPEFFEMLQRVHSAAAKRARNMGLLQQTTNASKSLTHVKVGDVPWYTRVGASQHQSGGSGAPIAECLVAVYTFAVLTVGLAMMLFLNCCAPDPREEALRLYFNAPPTPHVGFPGTSVEPRRPEGSAFTYPYAHGMPRRMPMMWSPPERGRQPVREGLDHPAKPVLIME